MLSSHKLAGDHKGRWEKAKQEGKGKGTLEVAKEHWRWQRKIGDSRKDKMIEGKMGEGQA
jgi:hypothetical protein